jgi:hypothetical protein
LLTGARYEHRRRLAGALSEGIVVEGKECRHSPDPSTRMEPYVQAVHRLLLTAIDTLAWRFGDI